MPCNTGDRGDNEAGRMLPTKMPGRVPTAITQAMGQTMRRSLIYLPTPPGTDTTL